METSHRAAGYRRVSMREQVNGFSLDAQETHIRTYVQSQGWSLVEIYTDAGISARQGSRRPALEQLLKDARENKFDVVVVDKIDRFYRHLGGLLTALDQLHNAGVAFASVQEKLDFTTPWGKLMLTVLGMLAEIYLDNLRQEIRKGKRQRARKGLWLGAVPFGYCNGLCSKCTDPNGAGYCPYYGDPNHGDGKMIIAHPVESQVVRLVFEWYKTGEYSTASIADKLNGYLLRVSDGCLIRPRSKGAPGRTEAGPFKRDVIRDMLRRIAYTGILPYQGVDINGKHPKRKQANDIFQGAHPALIDEATFQQVEQVRQSLCFNARHKNGSEVRVYPLTGILKCGFCGQNLRGSSNAYHRYYVDSSVVDRGQECQQATIRSDDIEQRVYTFLLRVIDDDESFVSLEALQSQLKDAEARFERAKELYLTGVISHATYDEERNRLENLKDGLLTENINAIIASINHIRTQINNWTALLPIEKKRLLRLAFEAAWVRGTALVAFQPAIALLPLLKEEKSSCCFSDRYQLLSYTLSLGERIMLVPPGTPGNEAISLIRYVRDGEGRLID